MTVDTTDHSSERTKRIRIALANAKDRLPATVPIVAPDKRVVSSDESLRLAEVWATDRPVVRFADSWWCWDGACYVEEPDDALARSGYRFLDSLAVPDESPKRASDQRSVRPIAATRRRVNDLIHALHGVAPRAAEPGTWLTAAPAPLAGARVVPVANGLLDLDAGTLHAPTPAYFATNVLGCRWDAAAPAPAAWLAFLDSIWGADPEAITALREWLGCWIAGATHLQKLFFLLGPPRSGKGTILRVAESLMGARAVCAPSLATLGERFGMAAFLGKRLATIADARFAPGQNGQAVVERLLNVSGEDAIEIERKHRDSRAVRLRCNVVLASNELPALSESSGALASRFEILRMTRSFLGAEDHGLADRLQAELPGILAWAREGWLALRDAGRFTQAASAAESRQHLAEVTSPVATFLAETTRDDPAGQVGIAELYALWQTWCQRCGFREPGTVQSFGRRVAAARPNVKSAQERRGDGTVVRVYRGIALSGVRYV